MSKNSIAVTLASPENVVVVVTFVMAWSPFRHSNAGDSRINYGDHANPNFHYFRCGTNPVVCYHSFFRWGNVGVDGIREAAHQPSIFRDDAMKKILTVLVATVTIPAAAIATPTTADARWGWGRGAFFSGLAAGAIIGGPLWRGPITTRATPTLHNRTTVRGASRVVFGQPMDGGTSATERAGANFVGRARADAWPYRRQLAKCCKAIRRPQSNQRTPMIVRASAVSLTTLGFLAVGLSVPSLAQPGPMGPCAQITASCGRAGFVRGGAGSGGWARA